MIPTPIRPKNKFKTMPAMENVFLVSFENAPIMPRIKPVKCNTGADRATKAKTVLEMPSSEIRNLLLVSSLILLKTIISIDRIVTRTGKLPPRTVETMPNLECRLAEFGSLICRIIFSLPISKN